MRSKSTAWATVARREMAVKLAEKSFIWSTVITSAMLIAGLVFVSLGGRTSTTNVAVTDQPGTQVVRALGDGYAAVAVADQSAATAAVNDGDVQAAIVPAANGYEFRVKQLNQDNATLLNAASVALRQVMVAENAAKAGIDPASLTKGATLTPQTTSGVDAKDQLPAFVAGIAFAVLFMMTAMMFGMQIAVSVVKEKESRVVEILSAAVRSEQLLFGKVLGNSILAMGQLTLYLLIGLVGVSFTSYGEMLPSLLTGAGWFVVFFLAGFLALSCLWAAAGAMATRYEDLQQTSAPMTMILMIAYFAAFAAKGTAQVVLSYVPIVSSVLMPQRILQGTAQWWEGVISLALTLAFTAVAIKVGSMIYRRGVLQTGGTMSWKNAFKKAS